MLGFSVALTSRQLEELAKLFLDLGKLVFASLVLGLFQTKLELTVIFGVSLLGLFISFGLFLIGLNLFREVQNG